MTEGQSPSGSRQSDAVASLGTIKSYRDLRVWKLAIELAVNCYSATKMFPATEIYGVTSQLRRAASSVAANIAEGYGRDHKGSYVHFLRIAQGSLKEVETHVIISARVGYLAPETEAMILESAEGVGKMLRSLIRTLEKST